MLNRETMPATVLPAPPSTVAGRPIFDPTGENRMPQPPRTEANAQTTWMIAVRDRRDRAAFARLFDFYGPRLKSVAIRSGASPAEAEDIVQDVMLSVWQKAAQYDPERAHVSGWIYRIARNRQIDLARRNARPEPEELTMQSGLPRDPDQILAIEEEAAELRRALARLQPEQKRMIEKAYLGELSHVEIRDDTGLPLGTIKSRIRLGLDRLRHELKGLRRK